MVKMVAFEGAYSIAGSEKSIPVQEYVIATEFATLSLKVRGSRVPMISVDIDHEPLKAFKRGTGIPAQREEIKCHLFFGRARRAVTRGGGTFSAAPFPETESYLKCRAELQKVLNYDEKAMNAWKVLTGEDESRKKMVEAMETAEQFKARQIVEQGAARQKLLLEEDELYGIF